MKFIWEEQDIEVGKRVTKPGTNEVWIIGYITNPTVDSIKNVLVSLNDGMVAGPQTIPEITRWLNEGYVPEELLPYINRR